MPIRNLFKNCSYYYGFAAYVAYFVNHPAYTPPNETLTLVCFALAVVCQLSNFRCVLQEPPQHEQSAVAVAVSSCVATPGQCSKICYGIVWML